MHVALHLYVMLRLRLLDAFTIQFVKTLLTMRFELGYMLLRRGLGHAGMDDAVQTATDMTAQIHLRLLLIGGSNVDADGAKVGHNLPLLVVPAPEQALDASGELRLHCPAKRQPKPPVTRVT